MQRTRTQEACKNMQWGCPATLDLCGNAHNCVRWRESKIVVAGDLARRQPHGFRHCLPRALIRFERYSFFSSSRVISRTNSISARAFAQPTLYYTIPANAPVFPLHELLCLSQSVGEVSRGIYLQEGYRSFASAFLKRF
jgi:hypothetical protein